MGEISRRDFLKLSGLGALAALLPNRGRKTAFQPQHYPTVEHIDPRFGVLMTVDDGYSRTFVPMADVFFRRQVPIAFFVMGRMLPILADYQGENVLEKIVKAGGIICNHSYSHPYFTHLDEKAIAKELTDWEDALQKAMGRDYLREMKQRFPYFRIPFGAGKNLGRVLRVLDDHGYVVVWWNWDDVGTVLKFVDEAHLQDALNEPLFSQVIEAIVRDATIVKPGDIMLLHSNDWSKAAVEGVLDVVQPLGWADPVASLAQAAGRADGEGETRPRFHRQLPTPY